MFVTHVVCRTPCTQCLGSPGSNDVGDGPCSICGGSRTVAVELTLEEFAKLFSWGQTYHNDGCGPTNDIRVKVRYEMGK